MLSRIYYFVFEIACLSFYHLRKTLKIDILSHQSVNIIKWIFDDAYMLLPNILHPKGIENCSIDFR